ncbi:MAG: hypothetical protein IKN18_02410, partial [Neisseriaceae bacterium]|nr:hypothetical protein [Neisseriaceae bacterium]
METENQQLSGSLSNSTVIASEQSERGNLHTTENGRLNQEIATPATQVRNDGLNSGSLKNEQPTADKGGFSLDSERQSALNDFFTERDARAFSARWKMQQLLPEIIGVTLKIIGLNIRVQLSVFSQITFY